MEELAIHDKGFVPRLPTTSKTVKSDTGFK